MKQHSFYSTFTHPATHDVAVLASRGNLEFGGNSGGLDDERMIAAALERIRQSAKQSAIIVAYSGAFSVNGPTGGNYLGAHRFRDHLHTQAYSEDGNTTCERTYDLGADPGFVWAKRSWRKYDALRMEDFDFTERNAVGAVDDTASTGSLQSMHQIPGKGIVIV